jgi:hypothetical protein
MRITVVCLGPSKNEDYSLPLTLVNGKSKVLSRALAQLFKRILAKASRLLVIIPLTKVNGNDFYI